MSSTERTRGSKERTIWPVLPGLIMDPEFVEGVDVFIHNSTAIIGQHVKEIVLNSAFSNTAT